MRDECFIRGQIPMTKSEVRAVSLSKLELESGSVLFDIGAGTGSVSVEAGLTVPDLEVYAIEKNEEAAVLIEANREKFEMNNIKIVRGAAPGIFEEIGKRPTHAFLGGTSGELESILDWLVKVSPGVKIVANAISLETVSRLAEWLRDRCVEAEIVSVQVSRAKKAGSSHMMIGQNPVYIFSWGGGRG